jgi:tRNA threonylcarbamoyl adenosine modification protein YeaZ
LKVVNASFIAERMSTDVILAYDCATVGASIALQVDRRTYTCRLPQKLQAASLISSIDGMLAAQGLRYDSLSAIVSTCGPGSFTGVRIGLAALHGFALVTHVPIKLLTTLEAVAWQQLDKPDSSQEFIVRQHAGKGEVFAQRFLIKHGVPIPCEEISLYPEHANMGHLPVYSEEIDAAMLCKIASLLPEVPISEALPIYIRPPDASPPAPYTWLK